MGLINNKKKTKNENAMRMIPLLPSTSSTTTKQVVAFPLLIVCCLSAIVGSALIPGVEAYTILTSSRSAAINTHTNARIRGLPSRHNHNNNRVSSPSSSSSSRRYNSDRTDDDDDDDTVTTTTTNTEAVQFGDVAPLRRPASSSSSSSSAGGAQFGDVAPLRRPASSSSASSAGGAQFGDVAPLRRPASSSAEAQFGEVMSLRKPTTIEEEEEKKEKEPTKIRVNNDTDNYEERIQQRRKNNIIVAIVSVLLALGNYGYQWTHPKTPIQLLVRMERASSPVNVIGTNNKPTVVDFWAPWCEQCRYMAPTLYQIEEVYKDQVNFVSINGDDPEAWNLIEAFGVDAIPHLALVEADGTVDTALIGPIQKAVLTQDLDTLVSNAAALTKSQEKQPLPHQMLDVFANRPPEQRILHFDPTTPPPE